MDFTFLFSIAAAVAVFVGLVLEAVKKTFELPPRYIPATSFALGIVVSLALQPFTDYTLYTMGVAGAIAGLSASGGFDLAKGLFVRKGDKK